MSKSMFEEVEAELNVNRNQRRKLRRRLVYLVLGGIFLFITAAVMVGNALS